METETNVIQMSKSEIEKIKADGNIHVIPREGVAHYENEYQSGEAIFKVFIHKTRKEIEQ